MDGREREEEEWNVGLNEEDDFSLKRAIEYAEQLIKGGVEDVTVKCNGTSPFQIIQYRPARKGYADSCDYMQMMEKVTAFEAAESISAASSTTAALVAPSPAVSSSQGGGQVASLPLEDGVREDAPGISAVEKPHAKKRSRSIDSDDDDGTESLEAAKRVCKCVPLTEAVEMSEAGESRGDLTAGPLLPPPSSSTKALDAALAVVHDAATNSSMDAVAPIRVDDAVVIVDELEGGGGVGVSCEVGGGASVVLPVVPMVPTIPPSDPYYESKMPPKVRRRIHHYKPLADLYSAGDAVYGTHILLWIQHTLRQEDNWSLWTALALSKRLKMPVIAVTFLHPVVQAGTELQETSEGVGKGLPWGSILFETTAIAGYKDILDQHHIPLLAYYIDPLKKEGQSTITSFFNLWTRQRKTHILITDDGGNIFFEKCKAVISRGIKCAMFGVDNTCIIPHRETVTAPINSELEHRKKVDAILQEKANDFDWNSNRSPWFESHHDILCVQDALYVDGEGGRGNATSTPPPTCNRCAVSVDGDEHASRSHKTLLTGLPERFESIKVDFNALQVWLQSQQRKSPSFYDAHDGSINKVRSLIDSYLRHEIESTLDMEVRGNGGVTAFLPFIRIGTISAFYILRAISKHGETLNNPRLVSSAVTKCKEVLVYKPQFFSHRQLQMFKKGSDVTTNERITWWQELSAEVQKWLIMCQKDTRPHTYLPKDFLTGKTKDPLWNAIQIRLLSRGVIHPLLLPYWARGILLWTTSPQHAVDYTFSLLKRYSHGGRAFDLMAQVLCQCYGATGDLSPESSQVIGRLHKIEDAEGIRKNLNFDFDLFVQSTCLDLT